jgi:hypothetical protein
MAQGLSRYLFNWSRNSLVSWNPCSQKFVIGPYTQTCWIPALYLNNRWSAISCSKQKLYHKWVSTEQPLPFRIYKIWERLVKNVEREDKQAIRVRVNTVLLTTAAAEVIKATLCLARATAGRRDCIPQGSAGQSPHTAYLFVSQFTALNSLTEGILRGSYCTLWMLTWHIAGSNLHCIPAVLTDVVMVIDSLST